MSNLLYGKVYFYNQFAGYLREEAGDRCIFTYDADYLARGLPSFAFTLPLQEQPHISENGLHPYFENLVAEGWLENIQMRALGKKTIRRFELLLAFGVDCIGAVSIIDPEPNPLIDKMIDLSDAKEVAAFRGRASLSGVQPKIALVKKGNQLFPAKQGEISTHIGKFSSSQLPEIVELEWLTTLACGELLGSNAVVNMYIDQIVGVAEQALIVERFDRTPEGNRIHFEEFNQLLNLNPIDKYDGGYEDMGKFLQQTHRCLPTESFQLFKRIIAGLLTGNTDMHFKNFALLYNQDQLTLAPSYDQVSASFYKPNQQIALSIANANYLNIADIKPKHIIQCAESFDLNDRILEMILTEFGEKLPAAQQALHEAKVGTSQTRDKLISHLEKRWNGTFKSIIPHLSTKR